MDDGGMSEFPKKILSFLKNLIDFYSNEVDPLKQKSMKLEDSRFNARFIGIIPVCLLVLTWYWYAFEEYSAKGETYIFLVAFICVLIALQSFCQWLLE
uniref:Transmembrane protein n=1 Tax=Caenorhabditis tropicalis TaxID=1561998 RepID=A0A1I7UMG4_9PELO